MELLAPAGDLKSFYAAVYNGADAVYLGLQDFNARIKADNFTTENIANVVEFAHLYHVKVYVTVNILVEDNEVEAFLATVRACVRAKVDAYIVQDLGMAQLLLKRFPNIVLHASTQMGIHNLSGAQILQDLGFKRVVLARETKLADIKLIRAQTNLEIEFFAQGALCVAFSGNCYLSSLKNGNSGNRGKCLQLCRLPYQVYAGDKFINQGYYLSAKDLCLMKRLPELITAGVDCLKIEGRLKRASYVAQVTRSYRQALDNFAATNIAQEKHKISTLFSRGAFNENAYLENNFHIINPQIGHHQGRQIGKVVAAVRFKNIYKMTLRINETIGQNDALRFVQGNHQISVGVGNVNVLPDGCVEIFSKHRIPPEYDVYLLKSEAQEQAINSYEKYLSVDFYFTAQVGKPAQLVANCNTISVTVQRETPLEKARTAGITHAQVAKQLGKLHDTKFRLNHLECSLDDVFIAVSELNELRRAAIATLERAMITDYNATLPQITESNFWVKPVVDTPQKNFYVIADAKDLANVTTTGFDVILCPTEYNTVTITNLVTSLLAQGFQRTSLYLNLPIVSTQDEIAILDDILAQQKIGIVANNYAHLRWVKQYPTLAGIGLNVYNNWTAQALLNLGCENIIWSLEKNPASHCGSALVSGYPALMTLCHCPVQAVFNSDCAQCRYRADLIYQDEKQNRYQFRRLKIKHCYFALLSQEKYQRAVQCGQIYDLRELSWKSMK